MSILVRKVTPAAESRNMMGYCCDADGPSARMFFTWHSLPLTGNTACPFDRYFGYRPTRSSKR
jgi:hypothetical protein